MHTFTPLIPARLRRIEPALRAGWLRLALTLFGGEGGPITKVWPGDVIIIPAGVSHKNLGGSPDFGVVGAYPKGQKVDTHHGKPEELAKAEANIAQVPMPEQDPVEGGDGALRRYWGGD